MKFKVDKKALIVLAVVTVLLFLTGLLKSIVELIVYFIILATIYHMFFSKDKPSENEQQPEYDKENYITPIKNEDSYTSKPPVLNERCNAVYESDPKRKENAVINLHKEEKIDDKTILLGHDADSQEAFYITDEELNAMTLLLGATGAGKTTAIKTILEKPIKNGSPVIIVDGKGSPSFITDIKVMCDKYDRNFKVFHMLDQYQQEELKRTSGEEIVKSYHYNSLRHGGYTELKDKIISLFDWSEEHYKLQAERFLQAVFKFIQLEEVKELLQIKAIDLKILSECLSVENLKSLLEHLGSEGDFLRTVLAEVEESAAKGLANRIQSICESELGELFRDTEDINTIDCMKAIEENDVIFFSLDSLKFPEYAKMLGRLVIADLKTVSPRFVGKGKSIYTVFDEFNVFASEIIVNLINKTREYGFRNIISTQELADMVINGDKKLLDQVWGNTALKISLRQDVPSSGEQLSEGISTRDVYKPTISMSEDSSEDSSSKKSYSVSLEEEYIFKPRDFAQLERGEAIVFSKFPTFRYAKIKIRRI